MRPVRALPLILLAFLAGVAGAMAGQRLGDAPPAPGGADLHRLLHRDLRLDAAQLAALERLEHGHALRRRALESGMRAGNARLAAAMDAEHAAGPRVIAAIEASHVTMGALQKETVGHVFAMRRLLRPDQAAMFDRAIARALIDDER